MEYTRTLLAEFYDRQAQAQTQQPHWLGSTGACVVAYGRGCGGRARSRGGGGDRVDTMLRLAAKLVSFFWRREDIPEEEAGQPGREPSEGKCAWSTLREALGRPVRWGGAVIP